MSDNLSYWRSNSYPIAFQNHRAGIIFSGSGIRINGYGTGGVNGNGDTWYSAEAGETQEGRPMVRARGKLFVEQEAYHQYTAVCSLEC